MGRSISMNENDDTNVSKNKLYHRLRQKPKPKPLSDELLRLAKKYGIRLVRDVDNMPDNSGVSAGNDEIMLSNYDSADCELITFFHELAHCTFFTNMKQYLGVDNVMCLSILSLEGACWEYGLLLAKKNGYEWSIDSEPYKYAYNEYLTYINNEYDKVRFGKD
jgi:hypothetical protein